MAIRYSNIFLPAASAILGVALAAPAAASPMFPSPVGQDLTLGGVSHPRTVQSAGNNPASPVTSDRKGIWFGMGAVGVGFEVGDVDRLLDQAEDLEKTLDDEDMTQQEAEDAKVKFDKFLVELGDQGYVKIFNHVQPPFLPLGGSLPFMDGTVALGIVAFSGARVGILDAPVEVQPTGDGDFEIQSRTSVYLKAAAGVAASLGYSGGVLHRPDGSLFVGGRVNYYAIELGKGVVAYEDSEGDGADDSEEELEDEFSDSHKRTSAVGLDLGAVWAQQNFRAGVTILNFIEPEFEYPAIGQNCASLASARAQRNCFTAASFSNEIALNETYTMNRQVQVETALFSTNRSWFLAGAYDVNSGRDAVGDESQWLSVSGGFSPGGWGWLVPGFRLGYRQNQAGNKLDFVTAGISLFRFLNLDVAAATDTVKTDKDSNDEVPRSGMVNLSFELFF